MTHRVAPSKFVRIFAGRSASPRSAALLLACCCLLYGKSESPSQKVGDSLLWASLPSRERNSLESDTQNRHSWSADWLRARRSLSSVSYPARLPRTGWRRRASRWTRSTGVRRLLLLLLPTLIPAPLGFSPIHGLSCPLAGRAAGDAGSGPAGQPGGRAAGHSQTDDG